MHRATVTKADGADGKPKQVCRFPPVYPEECMPKAPKKSFVDLVFDISPDGYTYNFRHTDTNNECVIDAAAGAIMLWKYEPSEAGATDIETTITLELH